MATTLWGVGELSPPGLQKELGRCRCGVAAGSFQCLHPEGYSKVVSGPWWGMRGRWLTLGVHPGQSAFGWPTHLHGWQNVPGGARKSKTEQDESGREVSASCDVPPAPSTDKPNIVLTVKEKCLLSQGRYWRVNLKLRSSKSITGPPSGFWFIL